MIMVMLASTISTVISYSELLLRVHKRGPIKTVVLFMWKWYYLELYQVVHTETQFVQIPRFIWLSAARPACAAEGGLTWAAPASPGPGSVAAAPLPAQLCSHGHGHGHLAQPPYEGQPCAPFLQNATGAVESPDTPTGPRIGYSTGLREEASGFPMTAAWAYIKQPEIVRQSTPWGKLNGKKQIRRSKIDSLSFLPSKTCSGHIQSDPKYLLYLLTKLCSVPPSFTRPSSCPTAPFSSLLLPCCRASQYGVARELYFGLWFPLHTRFRHMVMPNIFLGICL